MVNCNLELCGPILMGRTGVGGGGGGVSATTISTVVLHLPLFASTIQHPGYLNGKVSGLGGHEEDTRRT